jgi:hypothetical protein
MSTCLVIRRKLRGNSVGWGKPFENRDNRSRMQMIEHLKEKRLTCIGFLHQRYRWSLRENLSHPLEQTEDSRREGQPRMNGRQHPQIPEPPDNAGSRWFLRDQVKLPEDSRTGKMPDHPTLYCGLHQLQRAASNNKSISALKSGCPEEPGGIVDEALLVQGSDPTILQVPESSQRIDERSKPMTVDAGSHGIDTEIASKQICKEWGRLNLRQRRSVRVSFRPGGGEIEHSASGKPQMSGPEPGMRRHHRLEGVRQTSGHSNGIALNYQIDINIAPAKEEIPHIAADRIDRRRGGSPARRLERRPAQRVKLSELRKLHRHPALRIQNSPTPNP